MQCQRMIVFGRVQGVMFRDATRRRARKLGLAGYVRNVPDGSVEIVAAGDAAAVFKLFAWAERGPFFARVTNSTRGTIELPEELGEFEIRY